LSLRNEAKPKHPEAPSRTKVTMLEVEKFSLILQETRSGILVNIIKEPNNQTLMMKFTVRDTGYRKLVTKVGRVTENTIGTTLGREKKNGTLEGVFNKQSHSPQRKLGKNSSSRNPLLGSNLATLVSRSSRP